MSPDGQRVIFLTADLGLDVINIDGSSQRTRTLLPPPAGYGVFSPDARRIAVVLGCTTEEREVVVVDESGGHRVSPGIRGHVVSVHWSPDGASLLYSVENKVAVLPVAGGAEKVINSGGRCTGLGFTPDGRCAVFRDGYHNVEDQVVVDLTSGLRTTVVLSE